MADCISRIIVEAPWSGDAGDGAAAGRVVDEVARRRVIVESPFAAHTVAGIEANLDYARRCLRDSLVRGEATQVFDDGVELERVTGIRAGLAWGAVADLTAVYTDRGITRGMQIGIEDAKRAGRPVEFRQLDESAMTASSIIAHRRRVETTAQDAGFTVRRTR